MLVWLASYPRSGNTMCRRLLVGLYGLLTYAVYEYPVLAEPREGYEELSNLTGLPDFFKLAPKSEVLRWMHEDDAIYVVKTHELPPDDTYPAIYVARDGRDALVSYARFTF